MKILNWVRGICENSLHYLLNFSVNLKLFSKLKFFFFNVLSAPRMRIGGTLQSWLIPQLSHTHSLGSFGLPGPLA